MRLPPRHVSFYSFSTLLLIALFALPSFAGEVPESALSRSLRIRPQFLDGEGLLFAFPQRAARAEAQVFASTGFSSYDYLSDYDPTFGAGLGILARAGRVGFFVLTQDTPDWMYGSSTLYQAGLGTRASVCRFGAAVRGAYRSDQSIQSRDEINGDYWDVDASTVLQRTIEGAFGFGFGAGLLELDLAVEWLRSRQEIGRLDRFTIIDTLFAQGRNEVDGAWGCSARLGAPLGGGARVVASGSWIRPEHDWRSAFLADTLFSAAEGRSRSETWHAGLAVSVPTSIVDRVVVSSMLRVRERFDLSTSGYQYGWSTTRYRNWWVAGSVEHSFIDRWTVRAGVEGRYEKLSEASDYFSQYNPDERNVRSSARESAGTDFSWGSSYQWRNIRLDGSVSTTLSLGSPLAALDAHILF